MGMTGSGKGLHTDQLLTANIGKNWTGYKFLAIWPTGEVSIKLLDEYASAILAREPYGILDDKAMSWLDLCHRVVLLKPGDCVIFTASGAHQSLSISEKNEVCMASYESLVPLHPDHAQLFINTGSQDVHHQDHVMACDELYEVFDDILDNIESVARRFSSLSEELRQRWYEVLTTMLTDRYFERHVPQILEQIMAETNTSDVKLEKKKNVLAVKSLSELQRLLTLKSLSRESLKML